MQLCIYNYAMQIDVHVQVLSLAQPVQLYNHSTSLALLSHAQSMHEAASCHQESARCLVASPGCVKHRNAKMTGLSLWL